MISLLRRAALYMGLILRESKVQSGSINLSATAEAGKVPGRRSNRAAGSKISGLQALISAFPQEDFLSDYPFLKEYL